MKFEEIAEPVRAPLVARPVEVSVFDRVGQWVEKQPDKLLYAFLDRRGDRIAHYTYREFSERIAVVASHLASIPELKPGDRLVLLYKPGLESICALFACARAGFIAVPAAPLTSHGFRSGVYQLSHIVEDSGAAAILMDGETRHMLDETLGHDETLVAAGVEQVLCGPDWIVTDEMREIAPEAPTRQPHEIFFLQYTSGSTSQPKGVIVTHEGILHNCGLVVDHETPVTVTWLPQHHDMGLIGYYIYTVLTGGTTHGFSPATFMQRPALWLETISKYRATASSAPNFAFDLCLQERRIPDALLEDLDLSSLTFLMAAAEPIKVDTYRRFIQRFAPCGLKPESFFVAYGLAEFTLAVTNYGRDFLRLNKRHLAAGLVRPIENASEISDATDLISCGRPLGDTVLRIVDPDSREALPESRIGEIWIAGRSACRGYWSKPELTEEAFHARVAGLGGPAGGFVRTGDIGFVHKGELYVCGRRKAMIIIRGQNHYAEDIERVVEEAFPQLRKGCVAAFEIDGDETQGVALVAEISKRSALPEPREVTRTVWESLNVPITRIAFVPPRSVVKTSSGKIRRFRTREMLLDGKLDLIADHTIEPSAPGCGLEDDLYELTRLKERYNLTGEEDFTLLDAGIDSLDLVVFLHWLKETVAAKGAGLLSEKIDAKLLGAVTIRQIFQMAQLLEERHEAAIIEIRGFLLGRYQKHLAREAEMMRADRMLSFTPRPLVGGRSFGPAKSVLLTGGSGFLGPFLLAGLLEQTEAKIHVLVRARDEDHAMERIRHGMATSIGESFDPATLTDRVVPLCGDLEQPGLGLGSDRWDALATDVDTIYHNGALVNYLLDYRRMRAANVTGVNEILKLAFAGRRKQFNHISTTFVFGWATKDYLYETDNNEDMAHLDFGYSQSKWVSEQLVHDARRKGLAARIFRPALITPSVDGGGENLDITIRLLSFMIKHGIGVTAKNQVSFMPADVSAKNIVSIANDPDSIDGVFHVVRDEYENMTDITDLITRKTGRQFEKFDIKDFVPEVIRRCTREDLLFPLLDFLIGSVDNISSMEFKLYESSGYKAARQKSACGVADPPLEEIVDGILRFLDRNKIL